MLALVCTPTIACDLIPPSRPPTLAEKLGGVKEIFGGTVIGYVTPDGTRFIGSPPASCVDDHGDFRWWEWEELRQRPECSAYMDIEAALFRVDVHIIGPAVGETATYGMTWGDGDCNTDFDIGDKWLIEGPHVIEELQAPIRDDEVVTLQRLAARPAFDMSQLYR
ncbi:hypothetical protein [Devosia sp. CN2-171]|uniref:hypothetical protein n=1 Tax=Devosia sp. CN2-171 TaxID=3400909 RepID=UPI003BF842BD